MIATPASEAATASAGSDQPATLGEPKFAPLPVAVGS